MAKREQIDSPARGMLHVSEGAGAPQSGVHILRSTEPSEERRHVQVEGVFMTTTNKCEHPACNCVVPKEKKYCSEACADKKKAPELTCQCQHPGCHGKALKV
jgi:hypothetical protein